MTQWNKPGHTKCVMDSELMGTSVLSVITASTPPVELVTQAPHQESANGDPSCSDSFSMWTGEAGWATTYSGPDAFPQGGCQPAGAPWRKDTRKQGMPPKISGRFITEECSHSWRWRAMVPVFTPQEGCPGHRGLVCSVCPQRTELGQTGDRLITNQSCA